jgi:hypothetical protein
VSLEANSVSRCVRMVAQLAAGAVVAAMASFAVVRYSDPCCVLPCMCCHICAGSGAVRRPWLLLGSCWLHHAQCCTSTSSSGQQWLPVLTAGDKLQAGQVAPAQGRAARQCCAVRVCVCVKVIRWRWAAAPDRLQVQGVCVGWLTPWPRHQHGVVQGFSLGGCSTHLTEVVFLGGMILGVEQLGCCFG